MKKILLTLCMLLTTVSCFAAATDYYVTSSGAGTNSGLTWANAMDWSSFVTDYSSNQEAGDRYFFEEGTYTIAASLSPTATGTIAAPVFLIGVVSGTTAEPPTVSDWAFGDDRPLIYSASGDYRFAISGYFNLFNIRWDTQAYDVIDAGDSDLFYNISVQANSSGKAVDNSSGRIYVVGSYFGNSGTGEVFDAAVTLFEGFMMNSYIKGNSSNECLGVGTDSSIIGNIFDSCSEIDITGDTVRVFGNVFYNMTTGLNIASSTETVMIFNNIFDNNTTGVTFADSTNPTSLMDYNLWSNNTTDVTNEIYSGQSKGANAVTSDITFTDASNGDFTLPDSSVAEGVGLPSVGSNIGLTGDYNINIGVDQTDTQSGGTGSCPFTVMW